MENFLSQKRVSKPIPVKSFNDNITFPKTMNTAGSRFFNSHVQNSSFFFKKRESMANQQNRQSKTKSINVQNDIFKTNIREQEIDDNERQNVSPLIPRQQIAGKSAARRVSTVQLNLQFDFKASDPPPLKKLACINTFNKQVLHMKTISPDSNNIQRRIIELRQIEHVQTLIRIINKKKVKKSDLDNAYNLLSQKMRGLKKIEDKFSLHELQRVREVEEQYRTVLRNKEKIFRSYTTSPIVEEDDYVQIIQELHFDKKYSIEIIQSPLNSSMSDYESNSDGELLPFNSSINNLNSFIDYSQSRALQNGDELRPVSRRIIPKRKSYKNYKSSTNLAKIKTKQNLPHYQQKQQYLQLRQEKYTKHYQQQPSRKRITTSKKIINKTSKSKLTPKLRVSKPVNESSTKSDISSPSFLPNKQTNVELLPRVSQKLNPSQLIQSQFDPVIQPRRASRRSSRFKFGQFEFANQLVRQSKDISDILEEIPEKSKNQEKLITLNTVSSQSSKSQLADINEIPPLTKQKHFKIAPKKRITNANIDLLSEDVLQELKNAQPTLNNRRGNRIGRRVRQIFRPEDEFIHLDLNYNKSFVVNRDILQHQYSKIAKYVQSKDTSIQQQLFFPKPPIIRQKSNKRQYISANAIQQLSKQLKRSSKGDLNSNFYEFEGIRHSSAKKDKIAYYGITDYTYNEDPWFKRHERVEEKIEQTRYEDDLEQKDFGTMVSSNTKYMLNRIYRSR